MNTLINKISYDNLSLVNLVKMITKNIYEAKTELSKLIQKVSEGEEVIICKAGNPIASLTPYNKTNKKRSLGVWKGKVKVSEDFNDTSKEVIDSFYNN